LLDPLQSILIIATTNPRKGRDRRVTVGRLFALLFQVFLAWFTFRRIYAIRTGSELAEIHLVVALFSMIIAILHGAMGLPGMLKAALGSIAYRVALVFSGAAIALVSATFLLVFILPAAHVLPFGLLVPRGSTFVVSLKGGWSTLLAFGAAILMTVGYSYGAGLLSVLLVFRSDEKLMQHWLFKDVDKPSDWNLPEP
jgi:hypothetical protein